MMEYIKLKTNIDLKKWVFGNRLKLMAKVILENSEEKTVKVTIEVGGATFEYTYRGK